MRRTSNLTQHKLVMQEQITRAIVATGTALSLSLFPICTVAMGQTATTSACEVSSETETRVCKVEYHAEMGGFYGAILRDRASWEGFMGSMSDTIYHGDGTAETVIPRSLGDYSDEYFESGCLAVAYADLGSSGYDPSVTGITVEGNMLTIYWTDNVTEGCLYPCDMSGFVVIIELPANSPVDSIAMDTHLPNTSNWETETPNENTPRENLPLEDPIPDNPPSEADWPADEREGIDYEAGTILVGFPAGMAEEERIAFLSGLPFVADIESLNASYAKVSLVDGYPVNQAISDTTGRGSGYGIHAQPNFIYRLSTNDTVIGDAYDTNAPLNISDAVVEDAYPAEDAEATVKPEQTIEVDGDISAQSVSNESATDVTPLKPTSSNPDGMIVATDGITGNSVEEVNDTINTSTDAEQEVQAQQGEHTEENDTDSPKGATNSGAKSAPALSNFTNQAIVNRGTRLPATADRNMSCDTISSILSAMSMFVLGIGSRSKIRSLEK